MTGEALINWALHTGLDVSLLIVLVLVCRRLFVKLFGAQATYALWILPALRFVLPDMALSINRPNWLKSISSAPEIFPVFLEANALEAAQSYPAATQINWQLAALCLWFGGGVMWFAYNMWQHRKYTISLNVISEPASQTILRQAQKAAKTLDVRQSFSVKCAHGNIGPMITGLLNPMIILPENFETEYSQDQQLLALTHELAHIKRYDLWVGLAALIFRSLNWPNPLVHIGAGKFKADQEAACDATVLGAMDGGEDTKQNYAATLVHSAKLTRIPTGQIPQHSPLCLTIYHPLKERLMTLKTSKNNPSLLARLGVTTFIVAALAATAPLSIAIAKDNPEAQTKMTRVIKWVENIDGAETQKSFEIITENGVTTAYSIDEHGNKTTVNLSETEDITGSGDVDMNVFVLDRDDGQKKSIRIITKGQMPGGKHSQMMIKNIGQMPDGGLHMDTQRRVIVVRQDGIHASAMVGAAQNLLERVSENEDGEAHSAKVKRKLKKARKALQEAQDALAEEDG